jgi:hypothetical protein
LPLQTAFVHPRCVTNPQIDPKISNFINSWQLSRH